ncbi:SRPBCC family protein [Actinocrispum sp. NPDC049592]|uniref:SRPBCC family protein n=1 Tax=Actinocrispum sp. NPDC049592 TaxID=3154835 RepID=UPI0034361BB8
MSPIPTGRLFPTSTGADLVLTRTFRAPVEDVWASLTESERTARWFGPWTGEPGPGRVIKVQMVFEEGEPKMDLRIDACEPPARLAVSTAEGEEIWHLEALLQETGGVTELRLVHHLDDPSKASDAGPGWEYYLDVFVAAREDTAKPDFFADYYPAMKPYFDGIIAELTDSASADTAD